MLFSSIAYSASPEDFTYRPWMTIPTDSFKQKTTTNDRTDDNKSFVRLACMQSIIYLSLAAANSVRALINAFINTLVSFDST